MSDIGSEWQVQRRRKGASRNFKSLQMSPALCNEPLDVGKTLKRIKEIVDEMRCEGFWKEWKEQMLAAVSLNQKDTESSSGQLHESLDAKISSLECVCYGLGTFSSCVSARYQLAIMLLLLDAAKEGKRLATKPTLFYLMHCGKALYNNLLWKNWSPNCLPLVVIIGNSFNGIRERMVEREFKRDYSYINQAVTICEERQLTCPSHLTDVFCDTALITFNSSKVNTLNQSTWTEPPEPQYQHCPDLEIILRESQNGEST
ncbi:SRR1-like protein isoform X2 [Hippocampus zosterae]|uniref:SRR1-like protein isoform X2 n=1 Tax=Hippocampus zosterae TaxID=109293 RepID=UPI00223CAA5F|nr:SRR1-like protein isoform X2 [Hippocampus zosterae]